MKYEGLNIVKKLNRIKHVAKRSEEIAEQLEIAYAIRIMWPNAYSDECSVVCYWHGNIKNKSIGLHYTIQKSNGEYRTFKAEDVHYLLHATKPQSIREAVFTGGERLK